MDSSFLLLFGLALVIGLIGAGVLFRRRWRLLVRIILLGMMFVVGVLVAYVMMSAPQVGPAVSTPVGTPRPTVTPIPFAEIVVAGQEIPRGMRIPAVGVVVIRLWPAGGSLPFNALQNLDDVIGKIARTDIPRESPVLATMLVDDYNHLAAVGPPPITPPLRGRLRYDQAVTGEINHQVWMEEWYFAGGEGETVSFTMETTTGDLAPFVMVWELQSGEWIDGRRHFDAQTMSITATLPYNGVYVISATRARANNGVTSGTYQLTASAGYLIVLERP